MTTWRATRRLYDDAVPNADNRAPSTESLRNKQEAQRQIDKLIGQNQRYDRGDRMDESKREPAKATVDEMENCMEPPP